MAIVSDIILRDTLANRPAASAFNEGFLYYATDETRLYRSNGTTWDSYSRDKEVLVVQLANIAVGMEVDLYCPFAFTITAWTLGADASGDLVIDIWNDTHANFPPTNDDSITNGNEPELNGAAVAQDTDLGDWSNVTIAAGSWLRFHVDTVATISRAVLVLEITRTS